MKGFKRVFLVSFIGVLISVNLYAQNMIFLQDVKLRNAPSLEAPVVKIIDKNTPIIILEKHGKWFKILKKHAKWFKIETGYIYSPLLNKKAFRN